MSGDPYQVLGVPHSATQEEIKKAYRKKAKQYHPDLHPDDPDAAEKMNEINEAYGMLTHPEKYARQTTGRSSGSSQNSYGSTGRSQNGYGGSGSWGSGAYGNAGTGDESGSYGRTGTDGGWYWYTGRSSGSGDQTNTGRNTYQGPGGWSSDFEGTWFEDLFGYGFGGTMDITPREEAGDSAEIRLIIRAIVSGRYQEAVIRLTQIPSTGRNARWNYLYAVAEYKQGHEEQAIDFMQRAVRMEPSNRTYQQILRQFQSQRQMQGTGQWTSSGGGGVSLLGMLGRIFLGIMLLRFFFVLLQLFLGGGFYY